MKSTPAPGRRSLRSRSPPRSRGTGREQPARKHFTEWVENLTRLQSEGEIERFETVLEPHGGELDGNTIVFGTPEKLAALQMRDDMHRLRSRATLDHAKFSVIWAATGEGVMRELGMMDDAIKEYEREPVLV